MSILEVSRQALHTLMDVLPLLDIDGLNAIDNTWRTTINALKASRGAQAAQAAQAAHDAQHVQQHANDAQAVAELALALPHFTWGNPPPEIGIRIFEYCIANEDEDPSEHPLLPGTLCMVCRGWDSIAVITRRLWVNIVLRGNTWSEFEVASDRGPLWLERCGNEKANLRVAFPAGTSPYATMLALKTVYAARDHSWHLGTIQFNVYGGIPLPNLCSHFQDPAPFLTAFHIRYPQSDYEGGTTAGAEALAASLFQCRAPRLIHATLPSFAPSWDPTTFQNITHLNVTDNTETADTSLPKLLALFRLPRLVEVELVDFSITSAADDGQSVFNGSLTKLTLNGQFCGDAIVVLHRLDLPALEYLYIDGFGASLIDHDIGPILSPFPAIQYLVIVQQFHCLRGMPELMQRMGNLRCLELRGMDMLEQLLILATGGVDEHGANITACPRLEEFTYLMEHRITKINPNNIQDLLVSLLTMRQANGCPRLRHIAIPFFNGQAHVIALALTQASPGTEIEVCL